MYFLGWISIVALSLCFSLIAFAWAYRSGQFSDQERARYLVLTDDSPPAPAIGPAKLKAQKIALIVIAIFCTAMILTPLIMGLTR